MCNLAVMKLSIVTSLYYSQYHLLEFYRRASAEASKITDSYEIILVNDDSPDHALDVAMDIFNNDRRVIVLDLSRNFGQHKAIMTGLAHASGDLVFWLDCDLEEEPELLGSFFAEMQQTGADVVYGVQKNRRGGLLEQVTGAIFYRLFNFLSSVQIPPNLIHARLMSSRYVANLLKHRDQNIYIAGLMALTGFTQVAIQVDKHHRGSSTYNLGRKLNMMLSGITSFSIKPLQSIFYLGSGLLLLSVLAGLFVLIRGIFTGVFPPTATLIFLSIWFWSSLIIFCLGVMALYLSSVVIETKERPYTIIRKVYAWPEENVNAAKHLAQPDLNLDQSLTQR